MAEEKSHAAQKAEEKKEAFEKGQEKMSELEENPPEKLEDWPTDEAKYVTFGGGDGSGESYDEGPTAKLGPSGVRHYEDGSVEVDGEKVDNPDEFKGAPIPGGPTDPESSHLETEGEKRRKKKAENASEGS